MAATEPDFDAVFDRLKAILEPYARELYVSADDDKTYGLDMAPAPERDPTTWFGAVRRGKRYVSMYLMPVYVDPGLLDDVSPALRKRMQGKSCFNFKEVDQQLFTELKTITKAGAAKFGDGKFIEALRKVQERSAT